MRAPQLYGSEHVTASKMRELSFDRGVHYDRPNEYIHWHRHYRRWLNYQETQAK